MRIVIIGYGMAGARLADELSLSDHEVTVLGAEPHPAYNRILLSSVLAGRHKSGDVALLTRGPKALTGVSVVSVDRAAMTVSTSDGSVYPYDHLVLATGSRALVPPLPGLDAAFTFRTLDDCHRILEAASGASSAIVLGGGLLGLEAARGLALRGLRVEVVHAVGHLMERQLDPGASRVLERTLGDLGITVHLSAAAVSATVSAPAPPTTPGFPPPASSTPITFPTSATSPTSSAAPPAISAPATASAHNAPALSTAPTVSAPGIPAAAPETSPRPTSSAPTAPDPSGAALPAAPGIPGVRLAPTPPLTGDPHPVGRDQQGTGSRLEGCGSGSGDGEVRGGATLTLSDGRVLAADLLVVACGVRAETALARETGLTVDRGIMVDDRLRTSDPHISAIGDCAQVGTEVGGLVAPAWEQARVLALRLSGDLDTVYAAPQAITRLKADGIDLAAMGSLDSADEELSFADPARGTYARLVIRDGKLTGAVLLGDNPSIGQVIQLFDRRAVVPSDRRSLLLGRAFGVDAAAKVDTPALMPDAVTVCQCNTVTKGQVVRCWREGTRSLDGVIAKTRATTGCGSCKDAVSGIVDWLVSA